MFKSIRTFIRSYDMELWMTSLVTFAVAGVSFGAYASLIGF